MSTVTWDVFPAVEPAFRQLGVHAMRLRTVVVVLAPLTLVPDPNRVYDPERAAFPVELVPSSSSPQPMPLCSGNGRMR